MLDDIYLTFGNEPTEIVRKPEKIEVEEIHNVSLIKVE